MGRTISKGDVIQKGEELDRIILDGNSKIDNALSFSLDEFEQVKLVITGVTDKGIEEPVMEQINGFEIMKNQLFRHQLNLPNDYPLYRIVCIGIKRGVEEILFRGEILPGADSTEEVKR